MASGEIDAASLGVKVLNRPTTPPPMAAMTKRAMWLSAPANVRFDLLLVQAEQVGHRGSAYSTGRIPTAMAP